MNLMKLLWHYWRTKQLKFANRIALENYQQKKLDAFRQKVLSKSPYFRQFLELPFEQWPLMNKAIMMQNFDQMNTASLKCEELLTCARQSEESKNFSPKIRHFSVGLSSGTSGQRGLFVVSPQEQQIWAGGILAKVLPKGIFAKERVALFLRADNNLYHSVHSHWLNLEFFGLFDNFDEQVTRLISYQPTLIVAPAQVLTALAKRKLAGQLAIAPNKVISAAEVLEQQDRQLLEHVFNEVGEVYQATEGFLASTCEYGTLHLNEEFIYIEPQWLDDMRFTPIITDFTRQTQPIVRYRLDDILVKRSQPCSCNRQGMAIAHIEGRSDDQLILPNQQGELKTVFADYCSRIIANTLPLICDYRLIQHNHIELSLIACCDKNLINVCKGHLVNHFQNQGIATEKLQWQLISVETIPVNFMSKRRRIIREKSV